MSLKNQYAFKLEGFNSDWTYVDSRQRVATYTNLDSSRIYTLIQKISLHDATAGRVVKTYADKLDYNGIFFIGEK